MRPPPALLLGDKMEAGQPSRTGKPWAPRIPRPRTRRCPHPAKVPGQASTAGSWRRHPAHQVSTPSLCLLLRESNLALAGKLAAPPPRWAECGVYGAPTLAEAAAPLACLCATSLCQGVPLPPPSACCSCCGYGCCRGATARAGQVWRCSRGEARLGGRVHPAHVAPVFTFAIFSEGACSGSLARCGAGKRAGGCVSCHRPLVDPKRSRACRPEGTNTFGVDRRGRIRGGLSEGQSRKSPLTSNTDTCLAAELASCPECRGGRRIQAAAPCDQPWGVHGFVFRALESASSLRGAFAITLGTWSRGDGKYPAAREPIGSRLVCARGRTSVQALHRNACRHLLTCLLGASPLSLSCNL